MKKTLNALLFLSFLISCSDSGAGIKFCEGISPEGSGVNCGKKFTPGELSVLVSKKIINPDEKFQLEVSKKGRSSIILTQDINYPEDPEKENTVFNIPFYKSGIYLIKIISGQKTAAERELTIADY